MRGGVVTAIPALAAALAAGCWVVPVERGAVVPVAELQLRQDGLDVYAGQLFEQGRFAEAFYVGEVEKLRQTAALTNRATGEPTRSLAGLVRGGVDGDTRGIDLELGDQQARVQFDDTAFWQAHAINEARAQAVSERWFPPGLTLQGRTVVTTLEEVQRLLQPGELVLSYLVVGEAVYAVAVTLHTARALKLTASAPALRAEAERLVADVRDPRSHAWWESAAGMYQQLLGPFEGEIGQAHELVVVPHGFLANVPFVVLVDQQRRPLLSRMQVRYLPSASLYRASIERQRIGEVPRMLVVANAEYPPPWPRLPAAELEGRTLWRVFPGSRLLVGAAATEDEVRAAYTGYDILHFATHGLLTGEASGAPYSSLVLTPSAEQDGYLSAEEIAALDLTHTQIAVLSACETSVSGGKRLDSIAAAFLKAGAPRVIGSQWQVSDDATALLMLAFYARFIAEGPSRALRQVQLELADSPRYGHPFYWAAFVYYGAAR